MDTKSATREYLTTHPWLTFIFDAGKFSHEIWMLLGAAQSKCKHIAGVPLDENHAQELYKVYLVKGVHATAAIEGNTLSETEVRSILEGTANIPPSRQYLKQEVDNLIKAYNGIADSTIAGDSLNLSPDEICHFNEMILKDLEVEDHVVPGKIRDISVVVSNYRGAPPQDCTYLLDRLCQAINGNFTLGDKWQSATGILKAIIFHLYLVWIHPFGDGNGRTARLVEVKLCAAAGIPKPACQLLSNFYNRTRDKYYRELARASKTNDISGFVRYALEGLVDQLDEQIGFIRDYQMRSAWKNIVHEILPGDSDSVRRRRYLALDLYKGPVQVSQVKLVSARVAAAYANATPRMLARDITTLVQNGLLHKIGRIVSINADKIQAWLPAKREVK